MPSARTEHRLFPARADSFWARCREPGGLGPACTGGCRSRMARKFDALKVNATNAQP